MNSSKDSLVAATATIVAARIMARAVEKPLGSGPALPTEFLQVYREIESVVDRIEHEDDEIASTVRKAAPSGD